MELTGVVDEAKSFSFVILLLLLFCYNRFLKPNVDRSAWRTFVSFLVVILKKIQFASSQCLWICIHSSKDFYTSSIKSNLLTVLKLTFLAKAEISSTKGERINVIIWQKMKNCFLVQSLPPLGIQTSWDQWQTHLAFLTLQHRNSLDINFQSTVSSINSSYAATVCCSKLTADCWASTRLQIPFSELGDVNLLASVSHMLQHRVKLADQCLSTALNTGSSFLTSVSQLL